MEIKKSTLNIFYEEEEKDRWFMFDRYPRKLIRRILRGNPQPTGHRMVASELIKGLKKIGVPYRYNDYKHIKENPGEIACVITSYLLDKFSNSTPIVLGASIFSHPIDFPDLLSKHSNIKKIIVPGAWMKEMFESFYDVKVEQWPVGIDTGKWNITKKNIKYDFLIYNKIRWQKEEMNKELITPITSILRKNGYKYHFIEYGKYKHSELMEKLRISSAVIFLCEHETQGLAYQQILSTNTPILAWDREGFWQDPKYYPHLVKFKGVSSVPYWDASCGEKFSSLQNFEIRLEQFKSKQQLYNPRNYILKNLTLEISAADYYKKVIEVTT